MRRTACARGFLSAVMLLACSDSQPQSAGAGDVSGTEDADIDFGTQPSELTPPEPPELEPCPSDWRTVPAVDNASVATCEPWTELVPCAGPMAQFLGDEGCATIGPECPEDGLPEGIPAAAEVLYVQAGASPGGNGSRAAPYASIGEAVANAAAGQVIAVAVGSYNEAVELPAGVSLWGACISDTALTASEAPVSGATVTIVGADTTVTNLRISGAVPSIRVCAGASVELDTLLIDGASGIGLDVLDGGQVTARRVVIRNTEPQADDPWGPGLAVSGGAEVDLTEAVLERNLGTSIHVSGVGSAATLTQVAVRETVVGQRSDEGQAPYAAGLVVSDGAQVEVDQAFFDLSAIEPRDAATFFFNLFASIIVEDPGTHLRLSNAVVRSLDGIGLVTGGGASADVSRVLFDRNQFISVFASREGSLVLEDAVVRGSFQRPTDLFATALMVDSDADAVVRRALFEGNMGVSVLVYSADSSLDAEDLVIRDTLEMACSESACPEMDLGIGLSVLGGASAQARRFRVSDNPLCGVQLAPAHRNVDRERPGPPELPGQLDLFDGEVSHNAVGVNVQLEQFDVTRLTDRVVYLDNERNLDAAQLPVPNPLLALPPSE